MKSKRMNISSSLFCFKIEIFCTIVIPISNLAIKHPQSTTTNHYFLLFILVRGGRPGRTVQMSEVEIRALCLKSREIFLSQPILLELDAPLKICGMMI